MPVEIYELSDEEIGRKIQKRRPFWVGSAKERKAALMAAKFAGVEIKTRANNGGGFDIKFNLNGK